MEAEKFTYHIDMKPIFEQALEMATERTRITNVSIDIDTARNGRNVILTIKPTTTNYLSEFFFCAGMLYERSKK